MSFGRRVHQLADLNQALAILHALDGDLRQPAAVAAIGSFMMHSAVFMPHWQVQSSSRRSLSTAFF